MFIWQSRPLGQSKNMITWRKTAFPTSIFNENTERRNDKFDKEGMLKNAAFRE